MLKILNKFLYYIKNFLLPITFIATIYIILFMFQRLEKNVFGANFMEFFGIILPFILLLIFVLINAFMNYKSIKENLFYNIVSFMVMVTIVVFSYRALFDTDMFMWYKYGYNINFSYFSDQIPPIKVMLYGLSITNVLLIIQEKLLKEELDNNTSNSNKSSKNNKTIEEMNSKNNE